MSISPIREAPLFIPVEPKISSSQGIRLGQRVSACGDMLRSLAKMIQNMSLGIIGLIGIVLTFTFSKTIKDFTRQQGKELSENGGNFIASFAAIFCLPALAALAPIPASIATPATAIDSGVNSSLTVAKARENRIRSGDLDIQVRLIKEMNHAKNQMNEEEQKPFPYLVAAEKWADVRAGKDVHAKREQVGDYEAGFCHAQGWRQTMEDEHIASSFDLKLNDKSFPVHLFGIFDGHGGDQVSKFLKEHLQQKLVETLKEFNPNDLSDAGIWNALKLTCVRLNEQIPKELKHQGSTATFALLIDEKIWTANVGDSRTILNNGGEPVQLSEDAKPKDERYQRGILKRGGKIYQYHGEGPERVNGMLAVGRAFGDKSLNGAITARPKITVLPLKDILPESHLILACDGIWDVAATKQIASTVHEQGQAALDTLAKNIVYSAFEAGSTDNLSILIVKL